jgi:integrase
MIERDPTALVKALKTPSSSTKGIFTPDQIHSLLQVASTEWQGLILAGFYTGQRLGDLSRLNWTSVDLVERSITFNQGKTGNLVKIPLHPKLYDWLATQSHEAPNVFPTLFSKSMAGQTGLSVTFSKLVTQAGISVTKTQAHGKLGRQVNSLTFHSLRHSFTSALANAGVSPELRMKLTGHLDAKAHAIYSHHELETLSQAVSMLPKVS